MSPIGAVAIDPASGVIVADAPKGLAAIHDPACAAVIWQRSPLASFQRWIDGLEPERLPRLRVILRPEVVRKAAFEICETCGTPNCAEREMLIDDAAAMANLFSAVTAAPYLRLRLDVVTTNACRKFHIDAVTARLVCTYRGTGTQYGIAADGAEPRQVSTVPTGAPILLRGTLWPAEPRTGLLHRSPPIEGTGETRLVLVIDPILDPADEPDRTVLH